MLEAHHYSADAKRVGSYTLPEDYDGIVNEAALYHAVRAYLNNQRQGTASTKTRAEVSGGGRKPWRQKGTGRARQGTIRAAQWVGGGVVFGPRPRSYRTDLPKKVRRVALRSALNARATDGMMHVIERFDFEEPKTRRMLELLAGLGLADRKVLILTAETSPNVYRSGRNLQRVHVMRYRDVSAYEILWADALVVEEVALGGHHVAGSEKSTARQKRAKRANSPARKRSTAKRVAKAKTAKKKTAKKKTAKKKGS